MLLSVAVAVTVLLLAYLFVLRDKDIPEAPPLSPFHHLDSRKAAIYENLRDLQFEFRVGKLSDDDYQRSKKGLQSELAAVLAEIDVIKAAPVSENGIGSVPQFGKTCPHCGAKFEKKLKFCGDCGKPMTVNA